MQDMSLTVLDQNKCRVVCLLPTNHANKTSLKDKSSIRNLPILESQSVGNAAGMETRRTVKVTDSVTKTVDRSDYLLTELINELHNGLSEEWSDLVLYVLLAFSVLFASYFVLLLELRLITFEFSWFIGALSRDNYNEMVCPLKTESTSASEETLFRSSREN